MEGSKEGKDSIMMKWASILCRNADIKAFAGR